VVESREVCITLLFMGIDSEELGWPWWQLGRIRVERDPTLFGLLNGDVGNLCGWSNIGKKYYVSLLFTFRCIFMFFMFLSSRYRVA
jgi:hypothetical protein